MEKENVSPLPPTVRVNKQQMNGQNILMRFNLYLFGMSYEYNYIILLLLFSILSQVEIRKH